MVGTKDNKYLDKLISKLRSSGKTEKEINAFLSGLGGLSALSLLAAIGSSLSEQDAKDIEAIKDENEAEKKLEEIFERNSKTSVDDKLAEIQDQIIAAYPL